MRILLIAALAGILVIPGCLGGPSVRTVLLEESFAFDERAPAEAIDALGKPSGCGSPFDATARTLHLGGQRPTFVILFFRSSDSRGPAGAADPTAGEYSISLSGDVEGPEILEPATTMVAEKGEGYHGVMFGGSGILTPSLEWSDDFVKFEDEELREGVAVQRERSFEIERENVTYGQTHRVTATYLGRVPYDSEDPCASS